MELKEIVEELEKGFQFHIVKAEWMSYDGTLVYGSTKHVVMTPESEPKFKLSVQENIELGLIERIKPLYSKVITTTSSSSGNWSSSRGYTIYICDKPFKVWIRHRGHTGDRNDDYDEVVESEKVSSKEELLKYFE